MEKEKLALQFNCKFLLKQIFENTNHQQENHVVRRQQKRSLQFYNKVSYSYSKPNADFQF